MAVASETHCIVKILCGWILTTLDSNILWLSNALMTGVEYADMCTRSLHTWFHLIILAELYGQGWHGGKRSSGIVEVVDCKKLSRLTDQRSGYAFSCSPVTYLLTMTGGTSLLWLHRHLPSLLCYRAGWVSFKTNNSCPALTFFREIIIQ